MSGTGASPEEPRITAEETERQPSSAPPTRPDQLTYGQPYTWEVDEGSVRMWVATPKEVTLHAADYDENCTVDPDSCSKPGAAAKYLRVAVKLEGTSGRVEWASLFEFTYETPGGDVLHEEFPAMTFEDLYPLTDQVAHLSSGQKVAGNVYFNAPPGGRVQAAAWSMADQKVAVWAVA